MFSTVVMQMFRELHFQLCKDLIGITLIDDINAKIKDNQCYSGLLVVLPVLYTREDLPLNPLRCDTRLFHCPTEFSTLSLLLDCRDIISSSSRAIDCISRALDSCI